MLSIALMENGTFYLISRDHNQPIKRPEFNEVLYKIQYLAPVIKYVTCTKCSACMFKYMSNK